MDIYKHLRSTSPFAISITALPTAELAEFWTIQSPRANPPIRSINHAVVGLAMIEAPCSCRKCCSHHSWQSTNSLSLSLLFLGRSEILFLNLKKLCINKQQNLCINKQQKQTGVSRWSTLITSLSSSMDSSAQQEAERADTMTLSPCETRRTALPV